MKELTKSEEQMMDIFWDSKEALTSVDIVKMQVKATWTNGLVHNIIRSLVQNGYLKECGMEQFGRQYARKLMPALTREEYIAKSSVLQYILPLSVPASAFWHTAVRTAPFHILSDIHSEQANE